MIRPEFFTHFETATRLAEQAGTGVTLKADEARWLVSEIARLRAALNLAWEWSAKYPLQGAPSQGDRDAANTVYQACCAALGVGK